MSAFGLVRNLRSLELLLVGGLVLKQQEPKYKKSETFCSMIRSQFTFCGQWKKNLGAGHSPQSSLVSFCCPTRTVSTQETQHSSVEYQRFTLTESKSNIMPPTTVHSKYLAINTFVFVLGSMHQHTLFEISMRLKCFTHISYNFSTLPS